jgi:hypothetical protein
VKDRYYEMKKILVIGVIILFLGVAVKPSIATVQPELKMDFPQKKSCKNKEEVPLLGFCILHIWTCTIGGYWSNSFVRLECEDLDTGEIRYRTTGLFGHYFFIGLRREHTYKITDTEYTQASEVIELLDLLNYLELETIRHD